MRVTKIAIYFLMEVGLCTSCKKESRPLTINQSPIADAGADQTVTLPRDSVDLLGRGSDRDGWITRYEWKKVAGPAQFKFVDSLAPTTRVENLVEGIYTFQLKVTDNTGVSDSDHLTVTVLSIPVVVLPEDYRSRHSGSWNEASSWERFDGTRWVPALRAPSGDDGHIEIRTGDSITLNSSENANQLVINAGGALIIHSDFTIDDEVGVDLTNDGLLVWQSGQISLVGYYSTVEFINNGNFMITGNDNFWSDFWDGTARIVNNGVITKSSTGTTGADYVHEMVNTSTGLIQGLGKLSMVNSTPRSFFNDGIIAPGLPIGVLTIDNEDPFSSASVLSIEILDNTGSGSGHDEVLLTHNITLDGTLTATEIGANINKGRFTILSTSGTIQGNFSKTILPPGYSVQVNPNSVELLKQ